MEKFLKLSILIYNNFLENIENDYYIISILYNKLKEKESQFYNISKEDKYKIYNILKKYLFDLLILGGKTDKTYYKNALMNIFENYELSSDFLKHTKLKENIEDFKEDEKIKKLGTLSNLTINKKVKFYAHNFFYLSEILNFKSKIIKQEKLDLYLLNIDFCNHIKNRLIEINYYDEDFFTNLNDNEYEKFIQDIIYVIHFMFLHFSKNLFLTSRDKIFKEKYYISMENIKNKDYEFYYKFIIFMQNSKIDFFNLIINKKENEKMKVEYILKKENMFYKIEGFYTFRNLILNSFPIITTRLYKKYF